MFGGAPALHGGPRSSTMPLILAASTGSAGAAGDAAAADRRETGGLHDCFTSLGVRPSSCFPPHATRYAHRFALGSPARTKASGARAPRRRHAVAARLYCSPSVRKQLPGKGTVVLERTGITYVYFYTTFDGRTTKRRAGSPAARSSSEFSTALAGGRGAASASTASRSQAPREGSSAPPVWSRCSSACPRPTLSGQRWSLRTAKVS